MQYNELIYWPTVKVGPLVRYACLSVCSIVCL